MGKNDPDANLADYKGFLREWIPHGYIGNLLTLWHLAIFGLNIGMLVRAVRFNFLSAIIPTISEGGIVVLSSVYLVYRYLYAWRHDTSSDGKRATIGRASFKNDIDLVGMNFVFLIAEVTMLICYWTTVTINVDGSVLSYLAGEYLTVWDGSIDLRYMLAFFIAIKAGFLAGYALRLGPSLDMWEKLKANGGGVEATEARDQSVALTAAL